MGKSEPFLSENMDWPTYLPTYLACGLASSESYNDVEKRIVTADLYQHRIVSSINWYGDNDTGNKKIIFFALNDKFKNHWNTFRQMMLFIKFSSNLIICKRHNPKFYIECTRTIHCWKLTVYLQHGTTAIYKAVYKIKIDIIDISRKYFYFLHKEWE